MDVPAEARVPLVDIDRVLGGNRRDNGVPPGGPTVRVLDGVGVDIKYSHPFPAGGVVFDAFHRADRTECVVELELRVGGVFESPGVGRQEEGLDPNLRTKLFNAFPGLPPPETIRGKDKLRVFPIEVGNLPFGRKLRLLARRQVGENRREGSAAPLLGEVGPCRDRGEVEEQKESRNCIGKWTHDTVNIPH